MLKRLIFIVSVLISINSLALPTNEIIVTQQKYECPLSAQPSDCKIVCASIGNSQPFVKSELIALEFSFTETTRIFFRGQSKDSSWFHGYMNKETSCMIFSLEEKITNQT